MGCMYGSRKCSFQVHYLVPPTSPPLSLLPSLSSPLSPPSLSSPLSPPLSLLPSLSSPPLSPPLSLLPSLSSPLSPPLLSSPLSPLPLLLPLSSAQGEVFSWGSGKYGRLGHGHMRDRFSPLMIGAPLRGLQVVQIACHEYHSAALTGEQHLEQTQC